jgi:GPH family glycoside/pentoside/hexuronide:cation symporter|uniref:MFS transporter n=1 Tax=Sphingopyxis sp. MSC1_008 TaxID=2909265 RepID=UPI0020BEEA0B|nr:glycoside-pentoside-hexuronide (GPH):cation symporter [Sphingopyxis sp. MSC1_008]
MVMGKLDVGASGLSFSRKLAVGVGDFGFNLYWQPASLYLLYFYTDVLKLPPAVAGGIYMIALIWDAILDPIVGLTADRTRSRFGRYRPYLLFGAPVLAIAFILLFVVPGASSPQAVLLAGATHFLFRTLYAIVSVPYAALTARITRDAAVRADITGIRMVSATLAGVLVATLTLPLAQMFGGGRNGWTAVASLYAAVATIVLLCTAQGVRPFDRPTDGEAASPPINEKLRATAANWPLFLVLGAVAVSSFSGTVFQKNLLYYFKYVVGDASLGGGALGFCAIVSAVFVPVFALVARRWGKRRAWLIGIVPSLAGLILWRLADGQGTGALFVALGIMSMGSAAYYVCFWAMLPDTVEYAEWKTGIRSESFAFGLAMLGQKAALGLGAGLLGILLAHIGYVADAVQSPETLADLKAMMFWFPFAGAIVTAMLIGFYPITPKRHLQMVEEIAARGATS